MAVLGSCLVANIGISEETGGSAREVMESEECVCRCDSDHMASF